MPDWQVTATTVRCEAVADEVTLLVYKDWSVKCTGMGLRGTKRSSGCTGTPCHLAAEYRQKLQTEEGRPA